MQMAGAVKGGALGGRLEELQTVEDGEEASEKGTVGVTVVLVLVLVVGVMVEILTLELELKAEKTSAMLERDGLSGIEMETRGLFLSGRVNDEKV